MLSGEYTLRVNSGNDRPRFKVNGIKIVHIGDNYRCLDQTIRSVHQKQVEVHKGSKGDMSSINLGVISPLKGKYYDMN